ncbi:MAG TPA: hypothetical protein VFV50_15625 [Bdellovibrionales bacterium]|nr:hypothetical protein [Bdellovibrionales bacterium]
MLRTFLSFAFVLTVSITGRADTGAEYLDFTKYQPQGINLTEHYFKLLQNTPQVAADLKNVKVVLIEGIMANYVEVVGKVIKKITGEYEYYDDQMRWLKASGIEFERIRLDTEESSLKNSKVIAANLAKQTKPILLLTHSKGGVDALMALVNNPALTKKLVGMIAMQSPYLGTPVADYLSTTKPWNWVADVCLAVMGGSGESLRDLTIKRRLAWYQENQKMIQAIQAAIPILSFGSHKNDDPEKQDSMFEFSRNIMLQKMGVQSDGLVPWKSAVLPGGHYVAVEGLDHATTVSGNKFIKFDRLRFTNALFALFLQVRAAHLAAGG